MCTQNGSKVLTKMHFSSETLSFILQIRQTIVAGITSLTEASSDKQISSRYLCSPHLFKNTVAKCHTYSGSPNFLWNQFR